MAAHTHCHAHGQSFAGPQPSAYRHSHPNPGAHHHAGRADEHAFVHASGEWVRIAGIPYPDRHPAADRDEPAAG